MNFFSALRLVLTKPAYLILAVSAGILILLFNLLIFDLNWLWYLIGSGQMNSGEFIWLDGGVILFKIKLSWLSAIVMAINAIFFGVNLALLIFYLKKGLRSLMASQTSLISLIFSFLGFGCLSCGSIILTAIFGLSTTFLVINFLPFNGLEFGLISILLLIVSIVSLSGKISGLSLNCQRYEKN